MRISRWSAPLVAICLGGCLGTGEDRVTSIDATGVVEGFVYFDANGSREPEFTDPPTALVGVRLLVGSTQDTLVRALTDRDGIFSMPAVPVGIYDVVVDPATVPDSLDVVDIDPTPIIATQGDTVVTLIALSFPIVSVEEARGLAAGERVFVEGVALNAQSTFGDQTVHLAGAAAAIRVTNVATASVFAGDSVRFLATTSTLDGQSTLDDASAFLLAVLDPPTPSRITTADAAGASAGTLDAALVQVIDATVTDTATVAEGFELTTDDGSGPLGVLLDGDVPFTDPTSFVPGTVIDATGVLVPVPGSPGVWMLKPRSDADLTVK